MSVHVGYSPAPDLSYFRNKVSNLGSAHVRSRQCIPENSPPPPYESPAGGLPPAQPGYQYGPPPQGQAGYQYVPQTGQPVQVVVQYPQGYPAPGPQTGPPPPDYFTRAVFVTLCCFWPTGILAIMKASDARSATARGDYASATASANSARTMINLSICIGIVAYVFACVILGIYFGVILKNVYDYD